MAKGKGLSKREKKELQKKKRVEERDKARKEREQKEKRDRYFKYGALAVILIAAGFYLSNRETGSSSVAWIVIDPVEYDFGDVSIAGGIVKTSMNIRNTGSVDLVIDDMETSCGCTSATVEKDGVEGPAFGMKMHGTNPVGWSETIKPGETALLNVYYDPMVHPDLRGPVTRSITLYSKDARIPAKEIRIHVNQVN
jgi:hypothetical protein